MEAANGDEGIGIDVALCDGDMGAKEGELPLGLLYGSKRSSG